MPKLTEPELRISVISWDACKKEVLNIIKNQNKLYLDDYEGCEGLYGPTLIKEIEKL